METVSTEKRIDKTDLTLHRIILHILRETLRAGKKHVTTPLFFPPFFSPGFHINCITDYSAFPLTLNRTEEVSTLAKTVIIFSKYPFSSAS